MKRWACGAILTALLGAGCEQQELLPERVEVPADSAAGEVEFELIGSGGAALVVPVHVNGQGPYSFVLDTGATLTCVDAELARDLDLPAARGVRGIGAGATSTARMQVVELDSVRVGGARVLGLNGCALDLAHIADVGLEVDGLLGLNFLRTFRVTIDFQREVLHLGAVD